uniref:Fungal N-terminal domain-containing protein n=1 Tax=Colletotrichum fructicola (strain Nara gc5) TaxID=1213859 RepID=L2FJX5_COLFN
MAEALGLASGVIAVVDMATKVGGASIKLKRLWDEVKEAPYMLLQKAEQIQDFEEFLVDTELQVATNSLPATAWNSALLQKYVAKARTALGELQEIIDDLLDQATAGRGYKRKIGSTKAVFRKDNIKALDAKLDQALNLFKMAQGQYMMFVLPMFYYISKSLMTNTPEPGNSALMNSSHILNVERHSKQHEGSDSGEHHLHPLEYGSGSTQEYVSCKVVYAIKAPAEIFSISHAKTILGSLHFALGSNEQFQLSLRTPYWFSSSVYSIIAFRSISGWQVSLRAYEVVESLADVLLLHFWDDDPVAVFRFLDEHRMTPFVRDERGFSLLRLVATHP